MSPEKKLPVDLAAAVEKLTDHLAPLTSSGGDKPPALIGIQRRGVILAHRLAQKLAAQGKGLWPVGSLDITFYRDDSAQSLLNPEVQDTDLPFDLEGRTVVLVDDVLFTGRTIRCALDEMMDFGRPRRVWLAVLVDRGGRELPIAADFVGVVVEAAPQERVEVRLNEIDREEGVWMVALATGRRRSA